MWDRLSIDIRKVIYMSLATGQQAIEKARQTAAAVIRSGPPRKNSRVRVEIARPHAMSCASAHANRAPAEESSGGNRCVVVRPAHGAATTAAAAAAARCDWDVADDLLKRLVVGTSIVAFRLPAPWTHLTRQQQQ